MVFFLPLVFILLPFSLVQTEDVFERRAYNRGSECLKVGVFDPNDLQFNVSDTFVCSTVAKREEQLETLNDSDVLIYVLADKVFDDDANLMKKIVRKTKNLCIVLDSKRRGSISKAFAGFNWMKYNEREGILSIGEINIPVISPPSHLNQTMLMERFGKKSRLKIIEPIPPINLTGVQSPLSDLIHSPANATMNCLKDQHVSVVDSMVVSKEDIRSGGVSEEARGPRDVFRFQSESEEVAFASDEETEERTKSLLTDSEYLVNLGVAISLLFVVLFTLLHGRDNPELLQKLEKIQHENNELKILLKSLQEMNISAPHHSPVQQFQQHLKEQETDEVSEKEKKEDIKENDYALNKTGCGSTHITESDEPKILEPICQEKKYHIMLSYSGKMSKVVQALYKILTDAGYKVWYDKTELYRSGLHDKIAEGINQSVFVVLCLDSSYYEKLRSKNQAGFVKFEFDHAFWNDCCLIPVALEKELKVPSDWKDRSKVRTILCSQGIRELDEWSTLVQSGNEEKNTNHPQVMAFLEDLHKTFLQLILIKP